MYEEKLDVIVNKRYKTHHEARSRLKGSPRQQKSKFEPNAKDVRVARFKLVVNKKMATHHLKHMKKDMKKDSTPSSNKIVDYQRCNQSIRRQSYEG